MMRRNLLLSVAIISLVGCGDVEPLDVNLKGKAEKVTSGEYELEITESKEENAFNVRVGEWGFELHWQGDRGSRAYYGNSVLRISFDMDSNSRAVGSAKVEEQRLGLSAKVVKSEDYPDQFELMLSSDELPTVADYRKLTWEMSEEEGEQFIKMAGNETTEWKDEYEYWENLEIYLESLNEIALDHFQRFSTLAPPVRGNKAELEQIAEILTSRVLQPLAEETDILW